MGDTAVSSHCGKEVLKSLSAVYPRSEPSRSATNQKGGSKKRIEFKKMEVEQQQHQNSVPNPKQQSPPQNSMSSLETLIQAVQYVEDSENGELEGEAEAEEEVPRKRSSRGRTSKRSAPYGRTTHNLLEKNRRAQLRDCLEVLRQHVPLPDKLTTLALLQSAKKYIESLQQKEREENEIKVKLEHEHSILVSKLVELGAAGFVNSTASRSSPPPTGTTPTEIAAPNEGISLGLGDSHLQISPSPKDSRSHEEDLCEEDVVIDVLSEDDTSSTTSGSDGGCTSTSHKFPIVAA